MILHHGDCLEVLKSLSDNSIDSIVTDPPYGLAFMNKKWDYDVPSVDIWKECLRVLKPGGHVLSFGGTRTYHRMTVAIEDAGFEIRDQIQWLYGSGFPKSLNISKAIDKAAGVERTEKIFKPIAFPDSDCWGIPNNNSNGSQDGTSFNPHAENVNAGGGMRQHTLPATNLAKQWDGWGTALKPSNEPICLARKPISESTVAANIVKWGTGGINVDECRIETDWNTDPTKRGWQGGKYTSKENGPLFSSESPSEITGKKELPTQGRWPANTLFDEEAAQMLDEQSGGAQRFFMVIKNECGLENTKVEDTFAGKKTANKSESLSIDGYGSNTTAQFLMTIISITKTITNSIITFLISNAYTKTCIGACTMESENDISLLTELNIESVNVVDNTNCLLNFRNDQQELMKATAKLVNVKNLLNGEQTIESILTSTCESTKNALRFRYQAKAPPSERKGSTHPTQKPTKLMQYLIKLITPPNGTVLDPFAGSGTTGVAAKQLGFNFIGIEREQEYFEIAQRRVA